MIATIGLVFRLMRGWGFSSRFATLLALTLAAALSQAQYLRSLTVLPSLVTGGTSATGKLTLSKKAGASGATVTLNSSSSAATVPASVTVPGGASTASFTISTSPVSSNTMTMIEGTLGSKAAKGKLEIRAPKLISLSLNPNSVAGGESSTGTVKLDGPAPSAGIKVELRCSQPLVDLQNAVTIPGGSQQAGFIVATASITKSISATVFASEGTTSIHAKLSVNPVTIRALSVSPASVTGGNLTSGTLTLSGLAPSGGLKVDLSSDQACVIVPQGVIVPAGSSVALITVSTQPVRSNTTATITAKTGKTSVTATIVVETPVLSSVGLSSTAVVGGSTSTGTVTLTGPATGSGAVVTLLSSQASVTVPFNFAPCARIGVGQLLRHNDARGFADSGDDLCNSRKCDGQLVVDGKPAWLDWPCRQSNQRSRRIPRHWNSDIERRGPDGRFQDRSDKQPGLSRCARVCYRRSGLDDGDLYDHNHERDDHNSDDHNSGDDYRHRPIQRHG